MVIFWVMIKVLIAALCIGAAVSVIVFVPLCIYAIPYSLWVGRENTMGRHKDKTKESVLQTAKNATKLYKAWLTRQKPTF